MPRQKLLDEFLPKRLPARTRFTRVRLTAEEHAKLQQAADNAGLELSTWLRAVGLRAAEEKAR